MTQLYKKNGAVFIPVGITVEEVEKLKELYDNFTRVNKMTYEELANDYAQTECCNSCTDFCKKNKCKMYCNVRNAILYGLTKGREERSKYE